MQCILTRLAELDVRDRVLQDRPARTLDGSTSRRSCDSPGTRPVALASATEPLDLTSAMGRAMAKVIAVFGELESDTNSMRVSSAHEHLRREGRYTGGRVPYGYMVVPNPNRAGRILPVNEDEAKTIRRNVAGSRQEFVYTDHQRARLPRPLPHLPPARHWPWSEDFSQLFRAVHAPHVEKVGRQGPF
ncbi:MULTISPECIES: recombinase family protein [Streptomyces]|uniref:Recombinase family protein n=2 Tax=Streptomyces TaxID=1883 RepID=A0ABV9J5D5_9ACTN